MFLWKRKKIATLVQTRPLTRTLRILISLPYHYTTPTDPAKIPKNLSKHTNKLSFLSVTSITGDPSPFVNFNKNSTWAPTSFFLTLFENAFFAFLLLNSGNILHLSWLKSWLLMVSSTVKNGRDRLRKGNRHRLLSHRILHISLFRTGCYLMKVKIAVICN